MDIPRTEIVYGLIQCTELESNVLCRDICPVIVIYFRHKGIKYWQYTLNRVPDCSNPNSISVFL